MFIPIFPMFFLLSTFPQTHSLNTKLTTNTQDTELNLFFDNFIKKYTDFQIIFHSDSETIHLVNNIMKLLNKKTSYSTILVFNHDTLINTQFHRPNVSRVLSLLFSNNINIWTNLATPDKINSRDVVVFVSRQEKLKQQILSDGLDFLKFAGKVILIEKTNNYISIYRTCYYCGALSKIFQLLEKITNIANNTNQNTGRKNSNIQDGGSSIQNGGVSIISTQNGGVSIVSTQNGGQKLSNIQYRYKNTQNIRNIDIKTQDVGKRSLNIQDGALNIQNGGSNTQDDANNKLNGNQGTQNLDMIPKNEIGTQNGVWNTENGAQSAQIRQNDSQSTQNGGETVKNDISTEQTNLLKVDVKEILPSTFKNLNGHVLQVVFVQYFPFIYCKANSTGFASVNNKTQPICLEIKGIESDFMKTMSQKLNFTFLVHLLDSNQSFFNMIQYVNVHKADIAFGGISVTADRIPLVQFTKQYNFEDYHFLYVLSLTFQEIFDKFIEPFKAYFVWTLYLGCFILLSVSLYVALRIRKNDNYKPITLEYSFWTLSHFFFEQSHPDIESVYRSRLNTGMLLGLWWWICLILCNFYKSSILSALVQPPNMEPDDIEQLVRSGYRFTASSQYQDIITDLLHVPDPLYAEALQKTFFGEDACDVLNKILPGHIAMLDEYSELQFELKTICSLPDSSILEKFRIARKAVRSSGHGWATQLGAPYRAALDYYMSLVLSAGLFKKWTQNVTGKLAASLFPKSREIKSNSISPLSLKRFSPLLTIYSVGICVSVLCFFLEICLQLSRKLKKNSMKKKGRNNNFNKKY